MVTVAKVQHTVFDFLFFFLFFSYCIGRRGTLPIGATSEAERSATGYCRSPEHHRQSEAVARTYIRFFFCFWYTLLLFFCIFLLFFVYFFLFFFVFVFNLVIARYYALSFRLFIVFLIPQSQKSSVMYFIRGAV